MSEPYRDQLASALERADALAAENDALRAQLTTGAPAVAPPARRRRGWRVGATLVALMLGAGAAAGARTRAGAAPVQAHRPRPRAPAPVSTSVDEPTPSAEWFQLAVVYEAASERPAARGDRTHVTRHPEFTLLAPTSVVRRHPATRDDVLPSVFVRDLQLFEHLTDRVPPAERVFVCGESYVRHDDHGDDAAQQTAHYECGPIESGQTYQLRIRLRALDGRVVAEQTVEHAHSFDRVDVETVRFRDVARDEARPR